MGRSTRKEAIVKLREQLAATDDPEMIIRITRQIAKLLPRAKAVMGRSRNTPSPAVASEPESTFKASDYPRSNQGEFLATLPMGKREFWRLIFGLENTPGRSTMTAKEGDAVIEKMVAGFSEDERAALASYDPNVKD